MFTEYQLDGQGSPSAYSRYDEGRDLNYYEADPDLRSILELYLDDATLPWADERLGVLGARCGTDVVRRADVYDRAGHELVRYDRFGRDISRIAYHPDWLRNLDEIFDFGMVGWNHDPDLMARYGRAPITLLTAFDYLVGQADMALCCPIELAHGTVTVLERFADPDLKARLLPGVVSTQSATRLQTAQVATEITGGSDVGATRTEAHRQDDHWILRGEKWFASNIGADLIVTLGRVDPTQAGTTNRANPRVPGRRLDGTPNAISIRRLKDKLGTIGVPTGELMFDNAEAYLVGDAKEGFRYMAEMLNHTRYWNAAGSVGGMRRAFLEAAIYSARRASFGATLDSFPMIRERLIWLQVDLAATTALLFHTGAALDEHERTGDPEHYLRFRTLAPVIKYRAGEQDVDFARAAVEMLGGNGYVADFGVARLLRDAQVNPIWEGTSNICALDLWRAIQKDEGHRPVLRYAEQLLVTVRTERARRLADMALRSVAEVRDAVTYLAAASHARQEQQARRLADLFGDVIALCTLTAWADYNIRKGDHRTALLAELFARRLTSAYTRRDAVMDGLEGVPDLYPTLFGEEVVPE